MSEAGLEPEDLQRLAWSAGLTARDEEMLATQERVYHAWLEVGERLTAARVRLLAWIPPAGTRRGQSRERLVEPIAASGRAA